MTQTAKPKPGRKYDQALDGARDVFLREGFEGASVDQIARDAGISKATLYSYFDDKEALFLAVLERECGAQADQALGGEVVQLPVPEALYAIARSFIAFLLTDFALQMFRLCVAETARFPQIGRTFYESGPKNSQDHLIAYLESAPVQAALDIPNSYVAADQLLQLCRTDLLLKRLFGIVETVPEAQIDHIAQEAVRTFLARYARS